MLAPFGGSWISTVSIDGENRALDLFGGSGDVGPLAGFWMFDEAGEAS